MTLRSDLLRHCRLDNRLLHCFLHLIRFEGHRLGLLESFEVVLDWFWIFRRVLDLTELGLDFLKTLSLALI